MFFKRIHHNSLRFNYCTLREDTREYFTGTLQKSNQSQAIRLLIPIFEINSPLNPLLNRPTLPNPLKYGLNLRLSLRFPVLQVPYLYVSWSQGDKLDFLRRPNSRPFETVVRFPKLFSQQPDRELVPGIRPQTGIIHLRYGFVPHKPFRERHRITLRYIHACKERPHTAQCQICIKRCARDARTIGPPRQFFAKLLAFGNNHPANPHK